MHCAFAAQGIASVLQMASPPTTWTVAGSELTCEAPSLATATTEIVEPAWTLAPAAARSCTFAVVPVMPGTTTPSTFHTSVVVTASPSPSVT